MAIWRGAGGSGDATTDAANEASVASNKAAEAAASATAAASSATSAATEATTATTQASAASTSATNAASSASAASTSETNAATSASNASTSASSAATSATNAATSETNAANSASAAATSASNAATSESNASTSESNAAASAAAALSAFDNFDDKYLGAKASDPTTDNDGDPLVAGALYFNTTSGVMRVYTGSAWVAAYVSATGVLLQANNLSDVASALTSRANLGLTIGTDVQAHSAVLDATTASYTTAEETKLAGIETAATADQTAGEIKTAYESNADTNAFTDTEQTKLAGIEASADVTDATNVTAAGALMDSELTSEASVKALNQGVATTDSPSFVGLTVDTNTLAVDSTNNRVGIGTTSPTTNLVTVGTSMATSQAFVGSVADTSYSGGIINISNSSRSIGITSDPTNAGADSILNFNVDGTERMRINSSGNVGIGNTSPTTKLDVSGTVNATSFTGSGSSLSGLVVKTSATGSAAMPAGTTAQRDGSPSAGFLRFNSTDTSFEGYDGSAWGAIGGGGGASGGGSDAIFYENGQTITTSYSITASTNAMSTGPLTVNSGVSVTVPSGSRWVVL